ncbi:MAG: MerR family transcriptional regulator [Actinomycetota bacterium]|nr:MerR family transcriptional regulator [Actinomycetota bacterium]MDD5666930.1 MerR family transcriptional regulator [Actinomycetota bacterium]
MDEKRRLLRMKELEELTGLNRRIIHYYMNEGLLSPPLRTGKTMAYYSKIHVDEIKQVKELREQGYPVSLIKKGIGKKGELDIEASEDVANAGSRREQIIDKAVEIFARDGYHQAKIGTIAQEVGVVPSTLYLYFPNKKALFMECMNKVYYAMFKDVNEELWNAKQPIERLHKRGEMVLRSHTQFIDILQVLRQTFNDDPRMEAKRKEIYDLILYPLKRDIERAIEEGILPPLNVTIVSYIILGIVETAQVYFSLEKDASVDEFMDTVDGLLYHR